MHGADVDDRVHRNGWMVEAVLPPWGLVGGKHLLFAVALPGPEDAVAAVRKHLGRLHCSSIEARCGLSSRALERLSVAPGEIRDDVFQLVQRA